jgi:ankyrin repeat protein
MLRQSLATLPRTLDETYDRILASIREEDCVYAIRILQWLTFSARPLSIEEVAEVAATDVAREPIFDRDEVLVDPLEALEICSSLVTLTTKEVKWLNKPSQRIVTLAHYSVQEYLVSNRIKQGPAKPYSMQETQCHEAITKGCLGYLEQYEQPITKDLLENHMLARYSAEFWHRHLQKTGDEVEEVSRLAMSLFRTDTAGFLTWIRLHNPDHLQSSPNLTKGLKSIASPLYYASLLGLHTITKLLVEEDADVDARGGSYGNALQAAAANGHKAVVELLIDAGADVNAVGGEYRSVLRAAVRRTHEKTTRVLLERGADVGLDRQLKGAMHHAINGVRCTASLARMLQQYGAPLDTIDVDNITPMHYCIKFGHKAIATQLIDAGVPVDIRVRRRVWPHRVCKLDLGIVQTRLEAWPPISNGLTPLHFAALIGDATMVGFLLGNGADPNALSEYGETSLHLTLRTMLSGTSYADDWNNEYLRVEHRLAKQSFRRHYLTRDVSEVALAREDVVDALLTSPNISLTAMDQNGESALHCIRYGEPGSAIFVRKLVSRGADLLCSNLSLQTPLHLASKAGDHLSVKVLLNMGAKVTVTDKQGFNAFHYALQSGNRNTMIAILETEEARAAKLITSKDIHGQNVLHHILFQRDRIQVETIQWLMDQGADGSELDKSGVSPIGGYISGSSWDVDTDVLKALLAVERNATCVDRGWRNLGHLFARSAYFSEEILLLLHVHKVKLGDNDYDRRTVIHHATIWGHLTADSLNFLVNIVGIHADQRDHSLRTARQYAAQEGRKHQRRKQDGRHETVTDARGLRASPRWKEIANILEEHEEDPMNTNQVLARYPRRFLES